MNVPVKLQIERQSFCPGRRNRPKRFFAVEPMKTKFLQKRPVATVAVGTRRQRIGTDQGLSHRRRSYATAFCGFSTHRSKPAESQKWLNWSRGFGWDLGKSQRSATFPAEAAGAGTVLPSEAPGNGGSLWFVK